MRQPKRQMLTLTPICQIWRRPTTCTKNSSPFYHAIRLEAQQACAGSYDRQGSWCVLLELDMRYRKLTWAVIYHESECSLSEWDNRMASRIFLPFGSWRSQRNVFWPCATRSRRSLVIMKLLSPVAMERRRCWFPLGASEWCGGVFGGAGFCSSKGRSHHGIGRSRYSWVAGPVAVRFWKSNSYEFKISVGKFIPVGWGLGWAMYCWINWCDSHHSKADNTDCFAGALFENIFVC